MNCHCQNSSGEYIFFPQEESKEHGEISHVQEVCACQHKAQTPTTQMRKHTKTYCSATTPIDRATRDMMTNTVL
jgi:hypothetical protein